MQITGSSVQFAGQHQLQRQETAFTIARERRVSTPSSVAAALDRPPRTIDRDTTLIQPARLQPTLTAQQQPSVDPVVATEAEAAESSPEVMLLKGLVELLSGKKIELYSPPQAGGASAPAASPSNVPAPADPGRDNASAGEFETLLFTHHSISEYEFTSVSIQGDFLVFDEASGERWLSVDLGITMERHYEESQTSLTLRQGRLSDPLVLNFNNAVVQLSAETTPFDLNGDGSPESIASLASNSAYLSLDSNRDGRINDGTELFGPQTGNGFAELAQYDEDGNGFIDGGDSIYSQLSLYRPHDGYYSTLSEAGVTAIYTGSVSSPFQLNDLQNNNLGLVRSTGFFLNADKSAGVIQQIDLRV